MDKFKILALSSLVSLGIQSSVYGLIPTSYWYKSYAPSTYHSGSGCNAYSGVSQKLIRTNQNQIYVYNKSKNSNKKAWVKCPILIDIMSKQGKAVIVYLFHPSARTTTCSLVSSKAGGSPIKSTKKATGVGNVTISFNQKNLRWKNSTLYCSLDDGPLSIQPYGATRLMAYRSVEDFSCFRHIKLGHKPKC